MTQISESRTRELLQWLDDQAGDHTHLFEQMARYRDAAALIRQLQAAEQAAWRAGLDAGREQGRRNRLAEAATRKRELDSAGAFHFSDNGDDIEARIAQQPAATGEESSKDADVARPKRRPYDPSGSLSEYGVFPECDAQQPGGSDNGR